jgi:hypothetical protein
MTRSIAPHGVSALALLALCAGCGTDSAPPARSGVRAAEPRVSIAPPELRPDIQAVMNRGNEEFEAGDFEGALKSYGDAVSADSTVAAGWFGLFMSHSELGNDAEAEAARGRLRTLAPPRPGDPHAPATRGPLDAGDTLPAQTTPESGR